MTAIVIITLLAAFVNGGLGYGFSSLTVPVGLLYFSNRVLNPALVLVEVGANIYTVALNIRNLKRVWRRVMAIIIGLLPAILIGSFLLKSIDPSWIKLVTYCVLLPLILLQSFGYRRPLHAERAIGIGLGGIVGLLYSTTTISGPPLAILLNNEGFERSEFRAAIGLVRVVESSFTAMVYYSMGLFTQESIEVFRWIVPGVALAMPLGSVLLGKLDPLVFRRICISFDAWLIAYGFFRALAAIQGLPSWAGYGVCAIVLAADGLKLIGFFRARLREGNASVVIQFPSNLAERALELRKSA